MFCADTPAPWHAMLGSASWLQYASCGRGQGRRQQQVTERPNAAGVAMQGRSAIYIDQEDLSP